MKVNIDKLERQRQGALKFFNSSQYGSPYNYWGTFYWETGVGKTMGAILCIDAMLTRKPTMNVIVLVPAGHLIAHWDKDIREYFKGRLHMIDKITIISKHMLFDAAYEYQTDFLIIDELHEFYATESFKVITTKGGRIKYKYVLGLTATAIDPKGRHKPVLEMIPIIDEILEKEALDKGFISKFIEFNISVDLTEDELIDYDFYTESIKSLMPKFGKNGLDLAQKVLSGGDHNGVKYEGFQFAIGWAQHNGWRKNMNSNNLDDYEIMKEWSPGVIIGNAKELMRCIRERSSILYNSDNKIKVTLEIIQKFNELKTICFGQSTNFADRLHIELNRWREDSAVIYHSKLKTIMGPSLKTGKLIKQGATIRKRQALDAIRSGSSKVIVTASSLDKGFNVTDISMAITCAGTQNPVQNKQRTGRVKRLEDIYQSDTPVLIVNLYIPNSRDEEWLKKRQSKYKHTVYWVNSVEEIDYNPMPKHTFSLLDI